MPDEIPTARQQEILHTLDGEGYATTWGQLRIVETNARCSHCGREFPPGVRALLIQTLPEEAGTDSPAGYDRVLCLHRPECRERVRPSKMPMEDVITL